MRPIWKHELPSGPDEHKEERSAWTKNGGLLLVAIVAVALPVLFAAACGGTERGDASTLEGKAGQEVGDRESTPVPEQTAATQPKNDARGEAGARARKAEAGTHNAEARAGEARVDKDGAEIAGNGGEEAEVEGEGGPVEVTLRLTGDPGTNFSGTCSAEGTERTLDGSRNATSLRRETVA